MAKPDIQRAPDYTVAKVAITTPTPATPELYAEIRAEKDQEYSWKDALVATKNSHFYKGSTALGYHFYSDDGDDFLQCDTII